MTLPGPFPSTSRPLLVQNIRLVRLGCGFRRAKTSGTNKECRQSPSNSTRVSSLVLNVEPRLPSPHNNLPSLLPNHRRGDHADTHPTPSPRLQAVNPRRGHHAAMQRRPVLLTIFAGPFHTARETEPPDNLRNIWLPQIGLSYEGSLAPNGPRDCGL